MTEALVICILACLVTNTLSPLLEEGTRMVHEKLWKIIYYTKKYWIVIETKLNYLAIDHG